LLTIHLEKEDNAMDWVVPISGGWKGDDMDMDPTSAYHLAGWFETRMNDAEVSTTPVLFIFETGVH
jgi:hypothetical protein